MKSIRRHIGILTAVAAGLLFSHSCTSVKEDRNDCPCFLKLIPSEGDGMFDRNGSFYLTAFDQNTGDQVSPHPYSMAWRWLLGDYDMSIPRGYYSIAVVDGLSLMEGEGALLRQKEGFEADTLRACRSIVACNAELADVPVRLDRQYAQVNLELRSAGYGESAPYFAAVRGEYGALDLRTLRASYSPFSFTPSEVRRIENSDFWSFRIMRQPEDGLSPLFLDILAGDVDFTVLDTLRLDRILRRAGYNWAARDLEEVSVVIDFAEAVIVVSTAEWEEVYSMDVEI